jgi:hypothetical protein
VEGVNRKTTHLKRAGASLSVAIVLIAPGAAHASPGAGAPPAGAARETVAGGIQAPAAQRVGSAGVDLVTAVRGRTGQHADAGTGRGGLDRRDAVIGAAILVGVLLMGLWGHVAVGAVIGVVAWLPGAGARLVTGRPRRGRGWSDWPGPAVARAEQRTGSHRPLSSRPKRNLIPPAPTGRTLDPELH